MINPLIREAMNAGPVSMEIDNEINSDGSQLVRVRGRFPSYKKGPIITTVPFQMFPEEINEVRREVVLKIN